MIPDPHDDLAYIRQVMEQTRRFTQVSGNHLIAWGLLIGAGLVCDGVASSGTPLPLSGIWVGLIVLGWIYSLWQGQREARRTAVAGYATRLIGQLWIACGVAMTTAFVLGGWSGAVTGDSTPGLSALFIGIGVFMTGVLSGLNWFRNLALGWWAGAVMLFVWHGTVALWILAALFILLLSVPGLILNLQARAAR
ncbi:MAG TPA: hypothetical protein VGH91_02740 [Gammaproteobacteria bacterium]|jgi:hypothetical protein